MVMAPRLPELKEYLDNALRHMLSFLELSHDRPRRAGLWWSLGSLPTKDILWFYSIILNYFPYIILGSRSGLNTQVIHNEAATRVNKLNKISTIHSFLNSTEILLGSQAGHPIVMSMAKEKWHLKSSPFCPWQKWWGFRGCTSAESALAFKFKGLWWLGRGFLEIKMSKYSLCFSYFAYTVPLIAFVNLLFVFPLVWFTSHHEPLCISVF